VQHVLGFLWLKAPLLACAIALAAVLAPSAEAAKPKVRESKAATAKTSADRVAQNTRKARVTKRTVVRAAPERPSMGQLYGLHATDDPLDLKSAVALVIDQDTQQVLLAKNPQAVLPIASITKLMTALVVTEAGLPLDETLTISQDDVDTEKGSRSRLTVGTRLTRGEMLLLALMSSENRAAHALGRHYPGGMDAFVTAMNTKAQLLGMSGTRYVEPTGLSSENRSSANDLVRLVDAAYAHPIIRELSTSREAQLGIGNRQLQFRSTNGLVRGGEWDIGLQKTGYIAAAGRCLVMQAELAGRKLILVLLDSAGRYSRIGDAERIRKWLDQAALPVAQAGTARF
jgi:serine-type D-Ala-D-Ala endopeptidase (penicillin-binding protein 7)